MVNNKETWKNITKGRVGYLKLDRFGEISRDQVAAGKVLDLTPEERVMNSDRAATKDLDIFSNGWLVPVRLLEDNELSKEVASNPNLLSESDLKDLFKLQWRAFEKKVDSIDNTMILGRLQTLAEEDDSINVTVKQSKVIADRLEALTVDNEDRPELDADENVFKRIRAVTPS